MVASAQSKRAQSLQRLVALQRQLQKLAEADLAYTIRERDQLMRAIEDIVEAMSGMSAPHNLFPHLYARRLSSLKTKDQMLAGQVELHMSRINTERTRGDRAGQKLDRVNQETERHLQDETLFDLLDQMKKKVGP
jgi:hypothetical protein